MSLEVANQSKFCGAAKLSGLLTDEQIEEVIRAASTATAGPPLKPEEIQDEQFAKQAIKLGLLNRWQSEHLKKGRNKFTLGPYQILDDIGRGGMGHVFKGEHQMLGRIEAVKVLPKEKLTADSIARFQHEIRAHAQLEHPNLARLSYAGLDGSTYFFVTEYVPGTDLRRLVRHNGRLSMAEAATVISEAARGLQHAHERGLVHRDVKPGNLLVTPEGHTKVIDLGLADFLEADEESAATRSGKIVGTADYLAPEMLQSPGNVMPVSDIYSLGCTTYYSVTGKVPFPGGTTSDKINRHRDPNDVPLNPRRFNPDLDEAFLNVLADMMEKDPAKRIQTAAEVVRRLAPWTLEAFPTEIRDENSPLPGSVKEPPPLPIPAPGASDTEPHFLDENSINDRNADTAMQGTWSVDDTRTDKLPLGGGDYVKLGMGLYVYPSRKLAPLMFLVALVVAGLLLLGLLW